MAPGSASSYLRTEFALRTLCVFIAKLFTCCVRAFDAAHIDAYSDDAWPPEVLDSYERALSLAREEVVSGTRSRRSDPGMGIDLDVRDDGHFKVLSDLAPYTIHAEGWLDGRLVFSANDSGTALWVEVTQEQEAALLSRLGQLGIPSGVLTVLAPRR